MQIRIKTGDNEGRRYVAIFILMAIFSLLRIYRNSIQFSSDQQGGIWNIIAVVIVAIGLFTTLNRRVLSRGIITTTFLYSFLIWIHEILHMNDISLSTVYYFIVAPYFVFVILAFYNLYSDKSNSIIWIVRIVFIAVFIMLMYSILNYRRGTLANLLLADVYYLLCLLPILLFYEKNELLKLIAIVAVGLLIVISEKRAALLAYVFFVFCQYVLGDKNNERGHKIKRAIAFITLIVLCILGYNYIINSMGSRMAYRMSVLIESGGSGRATLYAAIWDEFKDSSFLEIVFGHGRGSISMISGVAHAAAHSDFLHILYVYGVFPFFLFVLFYIKLFLEWHKMKVSAYPNVNIYLGGLGICLMLSLFSTFCVSFGYVTCGAAFLGIFLADWQNFNNQKRAVQ